MSASECRCNPLTECECGYSLAEHIGGKPCTVSEPSDAKSLHDLPIFGWAWQQDAKRVER